MNLHPHPRFRDHHCHRRSRCSAIASTTAHALPVHQGLSKSASDRDVFCEGSYHAVSQLQPCGDYAVLGSGQHRAPSLLTFPTFPLCSFSLLSDFIHCSPVSCHSNLLVLSSSFSSPFSFSLLCPLFPFAFNPFFLKNWGLKSQPLCKGWVTEPHPRALSGFLYCSLGWPCTYSVAQGDLELLPISCLSGPFIFTLEYSSSNLCW